jgi:hypothetical protein
MLLSLVPSCCFLLLMFEQTPRSWCLLTPSVYGKHMCKELRSPLVIIGLCVT